MDGQPRTLVAGETLVDFVPERPGLPGDAGGYRPRFGGAPANVAVAMARLWTPPALWTRLAEDDLGDFLRGHVEAAGVPATHLTADADARTTLTLVTHDAAGDRSFTFYREGGADTRLSVGAVSDDALDGYAWVHTSGVPLSVEPARAAMRDLQARAAGRATVSFDPNWRPALWPSPAAYERVVREALDDVDVLVAAREDLEPAGFTATAPDALAAAAADCGPHTVVVTLGADGAVAHGTEDSPIPGTARHDGYEVDAVDTTGAGDAFVAALVAALRSGVTDGERALALANAAGAAATTRRGAVTGLSGLDAIRPFVDEVPWSGGDG